MWTMTMPSNWFEMNFIYICVGSGQTNRNANRMPLATDGCVDEAFEKS